MAPHTWAQLGDTVSDDKYRLYYRGQRMKEAYYRGEKIWGEEEEDLVVCQFIIQSRLFCVRIVGDNLSMVFTNPDINRTSEMPIQSGARYTPERWPSWVKNYALVTIYGKNITYMSFNQYGKGTDYPSYEVGIRKILRPFGPECSGITNIDYLFMLNTGLSELPEDLFINMPNVVSAIGTFAGCCSLKSIPEGLFSYMPNITTFDGVFASVRGYYEYIKWTTVPSLLERIPENLFANNYKAISFEGAFYNCESLMTIPSNLFAHVKDAVYFRAVFAYCYSLKTIPPGLFANNPKATGFSAFKPGFGYTTTGANWNMMTGAFAGCTSLESIPENLFANNPDVTRFDYIFRYCSSLKSIPENLFANNVKATVFINAFQGCTSLESIPEKLFQGQRFDRVYLSFAFEDCAELKRIPLNLFAGVPFSTTGMGGESVPYRPLYRTFNGCTKISGRAPEVWKLPDFNYDNNINYPIGCFQDCISLENYDEIPSNWK